MVLVSNWVLAKEIMVVMVCVAVSGADLASLSHYRSTGLMSHPSPTCQFPLTPQLALPNLLVVPLSPTTFCLFLMLATLSLPLF